jgi:hypothetical protein
MPFFTEHLRRPKGEVTIYLCHNGKIVKVVKKNLVVNGAYDIIAGWAAQDFSDYISQIAVGTGGGVSGDPNTPVPPTEYDTSLNVELARKTITSVSRPSPNVVEHVVYFSTTEAVGPLTEAGLFTTNNNLFARVTFAVINKSGMTMIVRWRLTF